MELGTHSYLPKASFKKLSLAYSNYMLTYHQFVDDCFNILESLILADVVGRRYRKFHLDYAYYLHLSRTHIGNLEKEINGVRNTAASGKGRRFKEWVRDVENDFTDRAKKSRDLVRNMERVLPRDWLSQRILGRSVKKLLARYGFDGNN
jgi:hypothetical protein